MINLWVSTALPLCKCILITVLLIEYRILSIHFISNWSTVVFCLTQNEFISEINKEILEKNFYLKRIDKYELLLKNKLWLSKSGAKRLRHVPFHANLILSQELFMINLHLYFLKDSSQLLFFFIIFFESNVKVQQDSEVNTCNWIKTKRASFFLNLIFLNFNIFCFFGFFYSIIGLNHFWFIFQTNHKLVSSCDWKPFCESGKLLVPFNSSFVRMQVELNIQLSPAAVHHLIN